MYSEELWFARDSAYTAQLDLNHMDDGTVTHSLEVLEEHSNYGRVLMYLDRKALKDLRDAIDYTLERKNKNGNV